MCGICGIIDCSDKGKIKEQLIKTMLNIVSHRGPDDEGIFIDQNAALGVRRLSIVDLSGGSQPIHNEDKSIWIAYNGEIYNFLELRGALEKKGHYFYTQTDTEVIVHLYEEYNIGCLDKLNGMFAFAIWDKTKRQLFLARDRFGIKPLYYTEVDGQFIFASELKSILQFPKFEKKIDLISLDQYLTFEYVPSPRSIFTGINKLPAGHNLIYRNKEVSLNQYWDIKFITDTEDIPKEDDCFDKLRYLLKKSIKRRLIGDVSLGVFLSGGIDSSSIVSLMSGLYPDKIKAFTIGFKELSFDELEYARRVARAYDIEHHYRMFDSKDVFELMPKIVNCFDEPLADASIFPTYLLSEFSRRYITVALGGEGGDEIFAGYPTYQAHKLVDYYRSIPLFIRKNFIEKIILNLPVSMRNISFDFKLKKFISGTYFSSWIRNIIWLGSFSPAEKTELYKPWLIKYLKGTDTFEPLKNYFANCSTQSDLISTMQHLDIKTYLQDDLLVKIDRTSMANSLEVRVPYLDHELVEFLCRLPERIRLKGLYSKYILKKSMRKLLPRNIIYRNKKGFGIPVALWLRSELKEMVSDIFSESKIKREGFFNYRYIKDLLTQHLKGRRDNRKYIWTLLMFELWYRKHMQ